MVMNTSQFQFTSNDFLKNLYIMAMSSYKLHSKQYPNLIKVKKTVFPVDKMMEYEGSASLALKTQGTAMEITDIKEGYVDNIVQKTYGFNMAVTVEQQRYSDKSVGFVAQISKYLTRSANLRYENVGISPINNGWTGGAYVGGDGVAYFSASHLWKTGGGYSNLLTAADLSQTSLKAAILTTVQAKQERNIPAALKITRIVAGTENVFILPELTKSTLDPESANNTYNIFKDYAMKKIISYYMTDTDAFVIDTDVETRCLKESQAPKLHNFTEGPSQDFYVGILAMLGAGHYNQLGSYGNAGS